MDKRRLRTPEQAENPPHPLHGLHPRNSFKSRPSGGAARRAAAIARVQTGAKYRFLDLRKFGSKKVEDRIRFHLNRGRDASYIVGAEGWLASDVIAVINKIQTESK